MSLHPTALREHGTWPGVYVRIGRCVGRHCTVHLAFPPQILCNGAGDLAVLERRAGLDADLAVRLELAGV